MLASSPWPSSRAVCMTPSQPVSSSIGCAWASCPSAVIIWRLEQSTSPSGSSTSTT
ncbi:Uncharacterised protein [Mycobacteroides abscessus]|nr:Uncharacterised protein [Mycobacteroides abscessus]